MPGERQWSLPALMLAASCTAPLRRRSAPARRSSAATLTGVLYRWHCSATARSSQTNPCQRQQALP